MNGEARPGDEEAWEEEEYEWGQEDEDEDEEDELDGDWYGDFSVPAATGGAAGGKTKTKKKKAKGLAAVRPLPARSASKVIEQHELAAVVTEWRMASRRSSAIDPKAARRC
jgi:hypothetical protein